jgi:hypothetical protein
MSFANCAAAYAAGYANIPLTSPLYAKRLDADHDGIGCDKPPANFVPHQDATNDARGVHSAPGAHTTTHGTTDRLPTTGPGEVGIVAALVLAAGVTAVTVARKRRIRFSA